MTLLGAWEGKPTEEWRALWGSPFLEIHEEVASTNDRARALAEGGAGPWTVVMAEGQTRGRGRRGRAWASAPGKGISLSVLVPTVGADTDALLPVRVGLAAARATDRACPAPADLRIKWPNDLLLGDRKVGGILCEATGNGSVVVGVGLNVSQAVVDFPADLRERAVSLEQATGGSVHRGVWVGAFLGFLREALAGAGPRLTPEEMDAYGRRDALAGRSIRSDVEGIGVARGITPGGFLVLEAPGGALRHVRAGSVEVDSR